MGEKQRHSVTFRSLLTISPSSSVSFSFVLVSVNMEFQEVTLILLELRPQAVSRSLQFTPFGQEKKTYSTLSKKSSCFGSVATNISALTFLTPSEKEPLTRCYFFVNNVMQLVESPLLNRDGINKKIVKMTLQFELDIHSNSSCLLSQTNKRYTYIFECSVC